MVYKVFVSDVFHWTQSYVFLQLTWQISTAFRLEGGSDGKESAYSAGDAGSIPGSGKSPNEGMATHSSILAWRIPWIEEPGGLQSMGSQRVGHD